MRDDKSDDLTPDQKKMLADVVSKRKSRERLSRDGAESLQAIRRRVLAFARERKLPPAEYAKLLHKRILTGNLIPFCEKHGVSPEWLLCGDLKALRKMTRERKETKTAASIEIAYQTLLESFGKLDRAGQVAIVEYLKSQV